MSKVVYIKMQLEEEEFRFLEQRKKENETWVEFFLNLAKTCRPDDVDLLKMLLSIKKELPEILEKQELDKIMSCLDTIIKAVGSKVIQNQHR